MARLPIALASLTLLALVLLGLAGWRFGGSGVEPGEPEGIATQDGPGASAPPGSALAPKAPYTVGEKTRDGTGKYYMGRKIAMVMGHRAINWLERGNREDEEAPSQAIAALDLEPDDVLADIGAGSGYYSFRIAPLVPRGKVIAVDIQPEMVAYLERKARAEGVTNIATHLGTITDTKLAPGSIDVALMVDAYHEFSHPHEMMSSICRALRSGGRVILLEYRAEDPRVPIKPLHKMTEAQVRSEMEAVGLRFVTNHRFLPWQHFLVFEKP